MENKNKQAFGKFDGLTKRELIATKLLAGMLSNNEITKNNKNAILVKATLSLTDELLKQLAE